MNQDLRKLSKINLHTWSRLTRFDLADLSSKIGHAALAVRTKWPTTGEGRQIKANTEKITRLLEGTHDQRDLNFQIDKLEEVVALFTEIRENQFFQSDISARKFVDRKGQKRNFGSAVDDHTDGFKSFVRKNRPPKSRKISKAENSKPPQSPKPLDRDENFALKVGDITPDQQPGPLQFEFAEGILRLRRQASKTNPLDSENVSNARYSLTEDARGLLQSLSDTNCDPRITSIIQEVEAILDSDADIIRLGLINYTCDNLFSMFSDELPSITSARFMGLSTGIRLYVAQFPEWQRFLDNAARSEFDDEDAETAYQVGKKILPALQQSTDLVDPQVPKSVELILETLKNPKLSAKRALFAAVRTLENLLAAALSEFAKLISDVSQGARSGAKKAAGAIAASGLLLVAANAAVELSPTAQNVLSSNWMSKAGELVQKALKDG